MTTPAVSVVLPTHAPHTGRLARTLAALQGQTLPAESWTLDVIDNASPSPVAWPDGLNARDNWRVVREPALGLSHARARGLREARAPLVVFVDDDNVLTPDYLARVVDAFSREPRLGAVGGRIEAEFEATPEPWMEEFRDLLALRDLGEQWQIARGGAVTAYPACAPVGAGMALRLDAAATWLAKTSRPSDRRGAALSSGGDNDLVLHILRAGWSVAYDPSLRLTHLIPAARLTRDYLGRLNRGIQRSWVEVLRRHGMCPWPSIPAWTLSARVGRAWLRRRAWAEPAQWVRWCGDRGRFEGQATPGDAPA